MTVTDKADIVERLRDVGCDREPFTPDHAKCVCRLTNKAADEIERMRETIDVLRDAMHGIDRIVRSPDTINALQK